MGNAGTIGWHQVRLRITFWLCFTAVYQISVGSHIATAAPDLKQPHEYTELLLSVSLNEQVLGEIGVFLKTSDDRLLASRVDMQRWRLRLPKAPEVVYQDTVYYFLDTLPELTYVIDMQTTTLVLSAPAALFESTALMAKSSGEKRPDVSPQGAFVNYDMYTQYSSDQATLGSQLELGIFNHLGVGINRLVAYDLLDRFHFVRLETNWTVDVPERRIRLRFGDSINRSSIWGRSVRFGGIQWGSNFALQPDVVNFPTPSVRGEAVVPSTVDVYLNNALILRRDVPPGPFEISSLPAVSGHGELQVHTYDLLGRRQTSTQPYYLSKRLLRSGVHDYSYEVGAIREDFGIKSNRYGRGFVSGTHRFGFTSSFTGEVHAEFLLTHQTVGISNTFLYPSLGVFDVSMALSRSDTGVGYLIGLGLERQSRAVSLRLSTTLTSQDFTQLGQSLNYGAAKWQHEVFVSLRLGRAGSVGFGYINQSFHDDGKEDISLVTAQYHARLGQHWSFRIAAAHDVNHDESSVLFILTRPLGRRSSLSMSVLSQGDTQQASAQFQRNPPAGNGLGYRLRVGGDGEAVDLNAGALLQTNRGAYQLNVAHGKDATNLQFGASGGVAWLGGRAFLTRRLDNSFAVVAVPGYDGVGVYTDNHLVARTDKRGYAFLPRLRPYESNSIRLDLDKLPLDAEVSILEQTAIPAFRSGLQLTFPIKPSRGAMLRLKLADGQPLPIGAVVTIAGHETEYPVAFDGEVYVTGLAAHNRLRATWEKRSCEVNVAFPDGQQLLPHLGEFVCLEQTR